MKKTICVSIVLAIAALPLSHLVMADPGREWICHVTLPNDRGHAIHVSHHAAEAHMNHGDCPANPGRHGCKCPEIIK